MSEVTPHTDGDPVSQAYRLADLHDATLTGTPSADKPRGKISESWRRSLAAGVSPEVPAAPLVYDTDRLDDARTAHPLDHHQPMLSGLLSTVADQAEHLIIITDADGHILWSEGPSAVRRQAEPVGLIEGFCWSEAAVGTNGMGTALTSGGPMYVYSAEHLARVLHQWSCAAAPIADPDSGRTLGCVDISATIDRLHPSTVALVEAAARLTEARLTLEMRDRDDQVRARYQRHLDGLGGQPGALVSQSGRIIAGTPEGWWPDRIMLPEPEGGDGASLLLPDGRIAVAESLGDAYLVRALDLLCPAPRRPLLTLRLLGTDHAHARLNGRMLPLSLRHAEILALLALHPQGLTAEQCSYHLYGDEGNPVTLRAEIHRLRAQLGPIVLAKPYRLDCDVDADFISVRRLLSAGDVVDAGRVYSGPLLPRSESPTLRSLRDELTAQLRRQLLDRGGPDALWAFVQTDSGRDDLQVVSRLIGLLPSTDPRLVSARLLHSRLLE